VQSRLSTPAQHFRQLPVKFRLSQRNRTVKEVIPRHKATRVVRIQMINVAVLECAFRERDLLGAAINQQRAIYERAGVEPVKQNPRSEVERFAVETFAEENTFLAEVNIHEVFLFLNARFLTAGLSIFTIS
jgi:hypothetical protein